METCNILVKGYTTHRNSEHTLIDADFDYLLHVCWKKVVFDLKRKTRRLYVFTQAGKSALSHGYHGNAFPTALCVALINDFHGF